MAAAPTGPKPDKGENIKFFAVFASFDSLLCHFWAWVQRLLEAPWGRCESHRHETLHKRRWTGELGPPDKIGTRGFSSDFDTLVSVLSLFSLVSVVFFSISLLVVFSLTVTLAVMFRSTLASALAALFSSIRIISALLYSISFSSSLWHSSLLGPEMYLQNTGNTGFQEKSKTFRLKCPFLYLLSPSVLSGDEVLADLR